MDEKAAVDLIRKHGCGGLGGFDGCLCTSFEVQGFAVDVSCRKGSGIDSIPAFSDFYGIGVRVHSRHMDSTPDGLEAVAKAIVADLSDQGYDMFVRYCSYEQDKKCQCVYCGKPREQADYLCDACKVGVDAFGDPIAPQYSYRLDGKLPDPTP